MPGIFVEPSICVLKPEISILGSGIDTTTIYSSYNFSTASGANLDQASIRLVSTTPNTTGNQTISNLTIDGSGMVASRAVVVKNRGGVKVHHASIKDFFVGGLSFYNNGVFNDTPPAVYDTGNEVYSCIIDNCGDH